MPMARPTMFASARGELKHGRCRISAAGWQYFENPAFAFDVVQALIARTVGDVFAKDYDARVAGHLGVQTTIDQINHGALIAGGSRLFSDQTRSLWVDVR